MKTSHKIMINIPDEVFEGISAFKNRLHIKNNSSAAVELIKYALSLPPYFAAFDWKKAEDEADADIATGKVASFSSVDEFLADLKA